MKKNKTLKAEMLCSSLSPEDIPYTSSEELSSTKPKKHPQARMMEALKLGLHITATGYNIFLVGEPHLGRSYLLRDYLSPEAAKKDTPPDLIFVYNFSNPDSPRLISLPAGEGKELKKDLAKVMQKIQKEMASSLDNESFLGKKSTLLHRLQKEKTKILSSMNQMATEKGLSLNIDENGAMSLSPMGQGRVIENGEDENLAEKLKDEIEEKKNELFTPISKLMRRLNDLEQNFAEKETGLEKELLKKIIEQKLDPLIKEKNNLFENQELEDFFQSLRSDMVENHSNFISSELNPDGQLLSLGGEQPSQQAGLFIGYPPSDTSGENIPEKYSINLFVDNSSTKGAPIIFEDHPTMMKLMGSIEREAEMGALVTHFSLIKAGSIHKANGGYLIVHAEDILRHSGAWEALIRSLRAGFSRFDDADGDDSPKAKSLNPESVPLSLKVILVGDESLYEYLLLEDERFSKLFKIKAHMTEYMTRGKSAIDVYLAYIKRIIDADNLLPFKRDALAGLIDYGSRIIEDQTKVTLMFPLIREIMVESSAMASLSKKKDVDAKVLEKTLDARYFRSNLIEEAFMEEYDRNIIKVVTRGKAIGRINGLALTMYGDFEFGLPHQISCTVGAGSGGIIDLERDAQLGGPIHTKAMMILKTYLVGAFAHNKPLILTGSLGFEQNYAGIEGDSASGAELAALLSALSCVPLDQSIAFTGAVGQAGEIMAVGGITRKIEGYFQVCKRHGLTGNQGVIIPKDNLRHLMLRQEVTKEAEEGRFHIYAIDHISEAMEILSGMKAGERKKDGSYTKGSLYDLTDKRLMELTEISAQYIKKT